MRAFVFPGQGGGVADPPEDMLPRIRNVIGERVPDQVKLFVLAARDADATRDLSIRPDVVAGHSLGEYGAAYAAGCFDFDTGVWLVSRRDHFLAEVAEKIPGGMFAVLKTPPEEVEESLRGSKGSVVANYNSPKQTVVSGLRETLADAMERVKGRKIPLNVSFAAHSPYVAPASENMSGVLDTVEFNAPEFPVVSAVDGSVHTTAESVKEALRAQMTAPVRWVKVVETLTRMRVGEWVELGGGKVLTRMLRDFELPSLRGMTFEDLRAGVSSQAQNLLGGSGSEKS